MEVTSCVHILMVCYSGKSTLALALFRFVDPTSGKIILDGIGKLHQHRSNMRVDG